MYACLGTIRILRQLGFGFFLGTHTYISIHSTVNHAAKIVIFLIPPTHLFADVIFFHPKWTFIPILDIFKSENRKLSWGVSQPKKLSHNVWNKEKLQRLRESRTIVAIKLHMCYPQFFIHLTNKQHFGPFCSQYFVHGLAVPYDQGPGIGGHNSVLECQLYLSF